MDPERAARWLRWGLVGACAILLWPLLPAVVLALWLGTGARVVHRPLTRWLGDRARLAAALTVIGLTAVLVPFLLLIASLAADAVALVRELLDSPRGQALLEQLVAPDDPASPGTSSLVDLLVSQKERAWEIALVIAGTATRIVISLVVLLAGVYALLIDGDRGYAWLERHAPISPALLARLRDAFHETGRGLLIGVGGAGLIQATIATVLFLALGVPRALELGLLTFCASIIPAIGTALVWGPVAAGLGLTGRLDAAIALALSGVLVIGTIDNLARPILARWGHLQLPTYVVLVAMFAGILVIGPWGLILAPLAVRLARAAVEGT